MADARRTFGLDVLRAVAIVVVLANHALLFVWAEHGGVRITGWTAHLSTSAILSIEWLFVLSGFLIGNMMIRSFELHAAFWPAARGFWLRRWFRTLPLYYVFLGVNVLLAWQGIAEGGFHWSYAAFSQNLVGPEPVPPFFVEAWSLALDEWFYLVLPLLVGAFAWLGRARAWPLQRSFLLATLALLLVPMLARAAIVPHDYMDWDARVRRVTVTHLDATGWGVLAAVASRWHGGWWKRARGAKALAGTACTVLGIWLLTGHYTPGPDAWLVATFPRLVNVVALGLLPLGAFLALPWITDLAPRRVATPAVAFVSTYSYSIYLCHLPLLLVALHWMDPPEQVAATGRLWLLCGLWLAAVVAVSMLTYHAFEKPVSDLRERFTRKVDANPFQPAPPAAGEATAGASAPGVDKR